jgi:hypothetical protein
MISIGSPFADKSKLRAFLKESLLKESWKLLSSAETSYEQ